MLSRLDNLFLDLKNNSFKTRVHAIDLLSKHSDMSAVSEVINMLSDASPHVRLAAVVALGKMGQQEGILPLTHALSDRSSEVRMRAAESLGVLLSGQCKSPKALYRGLKDRNELVRIESADSLGAIRDPKAIPALIKAIHDPSALVRSYAASALGEIGNKKVLHKLQKALRLEKSAIASVGLIEALYWLGQRDVIPALLRLLGNRNYRVRCATANVLSHLELSQSDRKIVLQTLREFLKQEKTIAASSSMQESIKTVMGNMGRVESQ